MVDPIRENTSEQPPAASTPPPPSGDEETRRVGLAFLRLLFYTRFSLAAGIVLICLGVLPWVLPTPTITAVYIQSTPARMATLTWISFLAAAMVIMTFRTTLYNAAARFNDPSMKRFAENTTGWIWSIRRFSWLLVGLPIPFSSLAFTWSETKAADMANPFAFVAAMLIGFLVALQLLYFVAFMNRKLVTANVHDPRFFPFDFNRYWRRPEGSARLASKDETAAKANPLSGVSLRMGRWIAEILTKMRLNDGYVAETTVWVKRQEEVEPVKLRLQTVGHGPLILFTLILLIIQLLVLTFGQWAMRNIGWIPSDYGPFGTLFYLVGLLMVFIGIVPGMAFYLDRFRIPTSWFVAVVFFAATMIDWLFPSFFIDHTYPVAPAPIYVENQKAADGFDEDVDVEVSDHFLAVPITLEEVIEGWATRQKKLARPGEVPNRTFVVVTAAGGGIQASGWTTTVLSGLAEHPELHELVGGIGVVSAVSGGSVGALQFLTRYPELMDSFKEDDEQFRRLLLGDAIDQSTRSSLEAVGWGLLFPDTWRNFGIVRDPTYDRGWVQEQVWADRMNLRRFSEKGEPHFVTDWQRADWRLGHLAFRVKAGELPAVVFNAFSTTTGQRIWMAPFQLRGPDVDRLPLAYTEFAGALGMQMKLSTAARISASFPYVSPTCIANSYDHAALETAYHYSQHLLTNCHLADGGYTDNEGLLTALELIRQLDLYYDGHRDTCPFDQVLLLRIAPFPAPEQVKEAELDPLMASAIQKDPPYLQSMAGPALGLYRGRTVTQLERGDLEVDIFGNLFALRESFQEEILGLKSELKAHNGMHEAVDWQAVKMNVRQNPTTQQYELASADGNAEGNMAVELGRGLRFDHILVDFRVEREGNNVHPPLSWKLNSQQKQDLRKAWENWQRNKQLADLLAPDGETEVAKTPLTPVMFDATPSQWSPVQSNLPALKTAPNILKLKRKLHRGKKGSG
ncbi:hypothetical protein Mal52_27910 [Symmachiella dynata]|uniref:PNPLA domain-containing protein n=1 Tax=Symmachiella dynata TaxID=2527995 RepID=A0A517ZPA3_9PLAN|nr:hypothetical protein [Symmachiella dynata]QDU44312.1 hypothetical protein Mal52_27910 [Symmachiella dynata]